MDQKLLHRLRVWRAQQAQREGVEPYRVLPNTTLEEIVRARPLLAEDFLRIKGIKEGRWLKYGSMLLAMVRDAAGTEEAVGVVRRTSLFVEAEESVVVRKVRRAARARPAEPVPASLFDERAAVDKALEGAPAEVVNLPLAGGRTLYTVGGFLEAINVLLTGMTVRVKGEVSSVDKRDRVVYFSLKDPEDESIVSCLSFRYHYDVSGVGLEVGQEVIVEGTPEIYKPTGRFSLKVRLIELGGEGALKKAYDDLKRKLEEEGLFSPSRKRALPAFPERIALITSNQGAAIGDFMMNLGQHGFRISLLNSSVEGKRAVFELIDAVKFFNRHPERYDALVVIRGGGSLESLQAFNNEALVREIAGSKIPVLAGIGHEKDVSLAALAADVMVSTPTATARTLREPWEKAGAQLARYEHVLLASFHLLLQASRRRIETAAVSLSQGLKDLQDCFVSARHRLVRRAEQLGFAIRDRKEGVSRLAETVLRQYAACVDRSGKRLESAAERLKAHDPERLLRLGYSLVMRRGKLVRASSELSPGDTVEVKLAEGGFESEVGSVF
jgi:exodeoxyribonuclease VII large subunit